MRDWDEINRKALIAVIIGLVVLGLLWLAALEYWIH
jgi:hypothetical protein